MVIHLASDVALAVAPLRHLVAAASETGTSGSSGAGGLGSIPLTQAGLPAASTAVGFVGGLRFWALLGCLAGLLLAAIAMALGHHSENPRLAGRGRSGLIVSGLGALAVGSGPYLINWFFTAGTAVH